MNEDLHKEYVLIDKYYSGQATSEELNLLNSWRKQSNQNNNTFLELVNILNLVNEIGDWKQFNKQKAWDSFQKKTVFKILASWKKISAIAAIFLVLIFATIWNLDLIKSNVSSAYISGTDHRYTILEDGSEFFLNPNSKLDLQDFSKSNRNIRTSGNYFVHVKKDQSKPFKIQTDFLEIKVLGTSFNVQENELGASVLVREGKVEVAIADGTTYQLVKNEKLKLEQGKVTISNLKNHNWGLFNKSYEDEGLTKVLDDISEKFGNFKFNSDSISTNCKITSKFNQATIIEVLEELSLIFDIDYTIKDGTIIVNKVSC